MARIALLIAAGFAVSFGAWLFSTDAEFVTPALAVNLALLQALLAAPPERAAPGLRPAAGGSLGGAKKDAL